MKGSRDESSKLSVSCPEVRAGCSCSWAKTGNWALRSVKSQYLLQGPSQVSEQVFGHHEVGSMTKKIISVIGQRLNSPLQNSLTHGFHVT